MLPKVKVVGVGGAGSNSVSALLQRELFGASLVCYNTDAQALRAVPEGITSRLLGEQLTGGLGAGGRAQRGFDAAMESRLTIRKQLAGSDLVFVTAGLGGGTGTGAAPVIAHEAKDMGATVVAVVTRPFAFEGRTRARLAEQGLEALEAQADAILIIENSRLLEARAASGDGSLRGSDLSIAEAMGLADEVLCDAVSGIGELLGRSGMVNLDFANVRALLEGGGRAVLGRGAATAEEGGAEQAVLRAINCPLLDSDSIAGARRIVFQVTAGSELPLRALEAASLRLEAKVHPDAEIAFGVALDESFAGRAEATVLATAIGDPELEIEVDVEAQVAVRRSGRSLSASASGPGTGSTHHRGGRERGRESRSDLAPQQAVSTQRAWNLKREGVSVPMTRGSRHEQNAPLAGHTDARSASQLRSPRNALVML